MRHAQQSHKATVDTQRLGRLRRVHYVFTVLYGIALCVLMLTSVVGIDLTSCAMNGMLALQVGVAFLLFGVTIIGRRMQKQYDEFYLYQDSVVLLAVTCLLALLFTLWPVVRIIQTLAFDCPASPPSTSPLCSTEYGFAIYWLIFMLVMCVLNVATVVVYIWLKH